MRRMYFCHPRKWLDLVPLKQDVDSLHVIGTISVLRQISFEERCILTVALLEELYSIVFKPS